MENNWDSYWSWVNNLRATGGGYAGPAVPPPPKPIEFDNGSEIWFGGLGEQEPSQ